MATFTPAALNEEGEIIGDSGIVVLEPTLWEGKRFPLLRHIDIGRRLASGTWILLIHRNECEICRQLIPHYVQLAHDLAAQDGQARVALIELPPFKSQSLGLAMDSPCLEGRVSSALQWRMNTPAFLRIRDARTELVTTSPEVLLEGCAARAWRPGQFWCAG
jgi:hypothetical protein